jgi:hypothetical protein
MCVCVCVCVCVCTRTDDDDIYIGMISGSHGDEHEDDVF